MVWISALSYIVYMYRYIPDIESYHYGRSACSTKRGFQTQSTKTVVPWIYVNIKPELSIM